MASHDGVINLCIKTKITLSLVRPGRRSAKAVATRTDFLVRGSDGRLYT